MTLTETVKNAGIIGAGGAGFPTHVKLASKPEFIIVNGAECEPLLMVDREICLRHADELLQALELVRSELGAAHAYYALKEKYREAVDALEKNIAKYLLKIETRVPQALKGTICCLKNIDLNL